jgi:hypothetical protein
LWPLGVSSKMFVIGCPFTGLRQSCTRGTTMSRVEVVISAFPPTGVVIEAIIAMCCAVLGGASMVMLVLLATEGCTSLVKLVPCVSLLVLMQRRWLIRLESLSINRSLRESLLVLGLSIGFSEKKTE